MTDAPGPVPIRVLIADDQRVVREGLSMLVTLIDDVEVVGVACDGDEAVRLAETHRPERGPDGPAHAGPRRHRRDRPTCASGSRRPACWC